MQISCFATSPLSFQRSGYALKLTFRGFHDWTKYLKCLKLFSLDGDQIDKFIFILGGIFAFEGRGGRLLLMLSNMTIQVGLLTKTVVTERTLKKYNLLVWFCMSVVYFDQWPGALQAVRWSISSFGVLTPFSVTNRKSAIKKWKTHNKGGVPVFRCYSFTLVCTQKLVD